MLLAVLSGFLVAGSFLMAGKLIRNGGALLLTLLPLSLFVYFFSYLDDVAGGNVQRFTYAWIPSAGINLTFYLDGLSLLFSLLITGIGTLIFIYAAAYLKGHDYTDRFFGYLCLFMASMLGLVLSDNLFTLFVFWELTSISSFFLIGFNNDSEASRKVLYRPLAYHGRWRLSASFWFHLAEQHQRYSFHTGDDAKQRCHQSSSALWTADPFHLRWCIY
jgi:multicomponent Na+:H+ antiporter subunit A